MLEPITEKELGGFVANVGAVFVTLTLKEYEVERLPSETTKVTEYCPTSVRPGLIVSTFGDVNVMKDGPPLYNEMVVGFDSASEHDGRV